MNFADTDSKRTVWMPHGGEARSLPEGLATIAESVDAPHAAIADEYCMVYGMQFHPEVGRVADQPLSAGSSAAHPDHVALHEGFVDKD